MPKRCPKKKGARKKKGRRKASRWLSAVRREYRKNKAGGLAAAMRRAKKTYKR